MLPSDLPPTDAGDATLRRFADAVRASPHNLVSRRAREELWDRHIRESVAFAGMLPRDGVLLDVGTGGGLPGMVIAIVRPDIQVTLLESNGKKTQFLTETVRDLDLPVSVLRGRAEELRTKPHAAHFTVVTARAVAPLPRLVGWTLPFLRPGGLLYAIKGERWEQELDAAISELVTWGGEVVATPDDLSAGDGEPMVVIIRRGVRA